jgi:hypothetical protein
MLCADTFKRVLAAFNPDIAIDKVEFMAVVLLAQRKEPVVSGFSATWRRT